MEEFAVIIDDDDDDARLLSEALNEAQPGLPITHYHDPKEALELLALRDSPPAYIFLDINMPGFNGHECLLRLRQSSRYAESIIVMLSTGMDSKLARILKRDGADYTYSKPNEFSGYGKIFQTVFGSSNESQRIELRYK